MNDMLKAGFSLMFFVLFGLPFVLIVIGACIAYPWLWVPFVFFAGMGILSASNNQ